MTHPLKELFQAEAPLLRRYEAHEVAVCEVSLLEIYVTKDCSFRKSRGQVMKEARNVL